jgi:hypothetical protein
VLASGGGRHCHASPSCFLCSADELGFDAPARALDAEEPLQPGQIYFLLQAFALRRIWTSAALAVKASRALVIDVNLLPSRRKGGRCDGEAGRLTKKAARVAPLVALSSSEESQISVPGNKSMTASKG